jgi:3-hydroxybutyryl-CoA dehydratase
LLGTVCTVGGLVVIEGEALIALPVPPTIENVSPVAFEKEAALA